MLDATDVGRMITVFIEGGFNFTGVLVNDGDEWVDFVDSSAQAVSVRAESIVLIHRHPLEG